MTEDERIEYRKLLKAWLDARKKNTDFWNQFMTGSGIPPKHTIMNFTELYLEEAKRLSEVEKSTKNRFEDFQKTFKY